MATTPLVSIETEHNNIIHDAQLDYYGKRLATASSDYNITIFEIIGENQYNQIERLTGHEGPVWQVSWAHPKFGVILASCSYDRSIIIYRESPPGTWSRVHKHEDLHTSSVNRCLCRESSSRSLVFPLVRISPNFIIFHPQPPRLTNSEVPFQRTIYSQRFWGHS